MLAAARFFGLLPLGPAPSLKPAALLVVYSVLLPLALALAFAYFVWALLDTLLNEKHDQVTNPNVISGLGFFAMLVSSTALFLGAFRKVALLPRVLAHPLTAPEACQPSTAHVACHLGGLCAGLGIGLTSMVYYNLDVQEVRTTPARTGVSRTPKK